MPTKTRVTRAQDALVSIAYDKAGKIISVVGLDTAGLAEAHYHLGTHVLGCCDETCGCWAAGFERGLEAQRGPLR